MGTPRLSVRVPVMTHVEVADWVQSVRPTIVAGAGVSYSSGLPLFVPFMQACLSAVASGEPLLDGFAMDLVGHFRSVAPEELFSVLAEEVGPKSLSVLRLFRAGEATQAHLSLTQAAADLGLPIVTTNFDMLFERAARAEDVAIDLVKVHGSADSLKSIRIAVNHVSVMSSSRVRRLTHERIVGRPLLVLGYRGLDSDLFPMLQDASSVVWLLHGVPPDGVLPAEFAHLAQLHDLRLTYGDAGGLSAGLATPGFGPISSTLDWTNEVEQWGGSISRLARYKVFGKLLRHVGLPLRASECYQHLVSEGERAGDRVWQAVGHDGLMKSDGLMLGDAAAAAEHFRAFADLAKSWRVRSGASTLSLLLNAQEALMIAGGSPVKIKWWLLAPPYPLSLSQLAEFGWLLNQWGRMAVAASRFRSARLLLALSLCVFRLLHDFQGYVAVTWSLCLLDLPLGNYTRIAKRMERFRPEDLRFVGLIFGYWLEWLLAEVDRLQGRPASALARLDSSRHRPLNRDEKFWDGITRAACNRAIGTPDPSIIAGIREPFRPPYTPQRLRQEAYVLAEQVLAARQSGAATDGLSVELIHALAASRSSRNRLAEGYLSLSLMLLDPGVIPKSDRLRLRLSPLPFVRVMIALFGRPDAGRKHRAVPQESLLAWACSRRGMAAEARWLREGRLPSASEIQFP